MYPKSGTKIKSYVDSKGIGIPLRGALIYPAIHIEKKGYSSLQQKPKNRDFVYFDWSMKNGVVAYVNNESAARTYPTLRELITSLKRPSVLIGESTFESYNLHERKAVYDLAMQQGHEWYGTPNRLTYRWRNRFGWSKTDDIDARTIRVIAEYPKSLNAIRGYKVDSTVVQVDGMSQRVYNELPRGQFDKDIKKNVGKGHWTRLRAVRVDDPEIYKKNEFERRDLFRQRQAGAMEFRRLDKVEKEARILAFKRTVLSVLDLDPGKTAAGTNRQYTARFPLLNNNITWAAAFAAIAANNRDEFEALLGAHAHGAKSMMRSQFYHWGWACNGKGPMHKGATLTDYRRQVRQLGSLVTKHDILI